MATFAYQARDPLGQVSTGILDVDTRDDAVARLKRDGLTVVELEEEDSGGSLIPRRVKQTDIIYATSQLAVMVDTGITLSAALGSIADHERNPTLKEVLLDLKSGQQVGFVPPSSLAVTGYPKFSGGHFWVNNFFPASYVEIDPRTGEFL